jgi:secreted trypsin-like serine protease
MRKSIFFLSLLLLCNYGSDAQQRWIVGGQSASEGQFPWVGDLRIFSQHFCGSALIHPKWVLTAAHCLDTAMGITPARTKVRFNSVRTRNSLNPNGGIEVGSEKFFRHHLYDENGVGYDIGLIKLSTSVTSVTPINLPSVSDAATVYQTGAAVKIAGWGYQDTTGTTTPDTMKWVTSAIYNYTLCEQSMGGPGSLKDEFCIGYSAGQTPTGGAQGDSGGPVWIEPGGTKKIIGVVSRGANATTLADQPGIYSRVAVHRAWIDSVMAANGSPNSIPEPFWNDDEIRVGSGENSLKLLFGDLHTQAVSVNIYSIEGKVVYTTEINNPSFQTYQINTLGMAQGMYILRISGRNGKYYTKKLVSAMQ